MNKIIELLIRAIPYPDQMKDFDIHTDYVEFTWRGTRYRVTKGYGVDEVGNGVLIGSDSSILIRALIDFARAKDMS
jgi:hypothetical protein